MPVENEDKYVLRDPEALRDALLATGACDLIEQFYLNPQARFRRTRRLGSEAPPHLEFTYKQDIGGRLLEIPVEVSAEDYALAELASVGTVHKARFSFPDGEEGAHWDVDFILDAPAEKGGKVILAMAECEYPEGGSHGMPDVLRDRVALAVPREHSPIFSNARISLPGYAQGLLERYLSGWRGEPQAAGHERDPGLAVVGGKHGP